MKDNSIRENATNVGFNESVQVLIIKRLDDDENTRCRVWYNAKEISFFQKECVREVDALKRFREQRSHVCCRGFEQIVFQQPELRRSRALFMRRVLDQQSYENRRANTDSRIEDRLAAKVRLWSLPSVDQAIMRAYLDVENHLGIAQHPIHSNNLSISNLPSSASFIVTSEQKNLFKRSRGTHCMNPLDAESHHATREHHRHGHGLQTSRLQGSIPFEATYNRNHSDKAIRGNHCHSPLHNDVHEPMSHGSMLVRSSPTSVLPFSASSVVTNGHAALHQVSIDDRSVCQFDTGTHQANWWQSKIAHDFPATSTPCLATIKVPDDQTSLHEFSQGDHYRCMQDMIRKSLTRQLKGLSTAVRPLKEISRSTQATNH